MIIDERMAAFIDSFDRGSTPLLETIGQEALAENVPVIRRPTASLLRFLISFSKPMRILEVGSAVGFSALWMSEYAPQGSHITTIEQDPERIRRARGNFARAGRTEQITLLEGDAAGILPTLEDRYDFIFLDAAKGQYIRFLPELVRLLADRGLLVSDNVLQDGDIIESRFAVTRRNRTIHARMREYLYALTHDPRLETVILPVGDGAAVTTYRPGREGVSP